MKMTTPAPAHAPLCKFKPGQLLIAIPSSDQTHLEVTFKSPDNYITFIAFTRQELDYMVEIARGVVE